MIELFRIYFVLGSADNKSERIYTQLDDDNTFTTTAHSSPHTYLVVTFTSKYILNRKTPQLLSIKVNNITKHSHTTCHPQSGRRYPQKTDDVITKESPQLQPCTHLQFPHLDTPSVHRPQSPAMLSRTSSRLLQRYSSSPSALRSSTTPQIHSRLLRRSSPFQSSVVRQQPFHSSTARAKGIQPDSSDPKPPNVQGAPVAGAATHVTEPSPLTPQEYYDYSEHYFNVLLAELEKAQEEGSDVEAEYSVSQSPPVYIIFHGFGLVAWDCQSQTTSNPYPPL